MGIERYDQLSQLVAEARAQFEQFQGGKKVAGARARKALQQLKRIAQEARIEVQDLKKAAEGGSEPANPTP